MLTTTELDADDSLYPIAFAITQQENFQNWKWFFECLRHSLDLDKGERVTIMSDMQKGLVSGVSAVFPLAEHRFCARHVYAIWGKHWKGKEFNKKFYSCAWSTFQEQFNDNLKAIGELNAKAAEHLLVHPPQFWSRSFFSCRSLAWNVDNNMSESFNAWIDDCRFLPIIRMIDGIRLKLMSKWAESENKAQKWRGNFSPSCITLYEMHLQLSMGCRVFFNGDDGYEVTEGDDRHTVFITRKQCTCRAWDLTSIPCQHAICALFHAKVDPVSQISRYYHKDAYIASYRMKFQPVRGKRFWQVDRFQPMEPPPISKLPGRPTKKRKRTEEAERRRRVSTAIQRQTQASDDITIDLPPSEPEKLSKRGCTSTCTICQQRGHNRATCRNRPESSNPTTRPTLSRPSQSHKSQHSSTQQSQINSTPHGGRTFYRSRVESGMGVRIDEHSGRTVYNPGLPSQTVINEGSGEEPITQEVYIETRGPIPNERVMRLTRSMTGTSQGDGSRKVQYQGDGASVSAPSNLPYDAPELMWRGGRAITTSRLLAHKEQLLISPTSRKKSTARRGRL